MVATIQFTPREIRASKRALKMRDKARCRGVVARVALCHRNRTRIALRDAKFRYTASINYYKEVRARVRGRAKFLVEFSQSAFRQIGEKEKGKRERGNKIWLYLVGALERSSQTENKQENNNQNNKNN